MTNFARTQEKEAFAIDESKLIKLNSVKKALKRIEEIKANRDQDLQALDSLIEKDRKAIAESEKALRDAESTMNGKAFRKAQEMKDEAEILLKMHTGRKSTLNSDSFIEEGEYLSLCDQIYSEMEEHTRAIALECLSLADKLAEKGAIIQKAGEDANKVLHILQHELYRDKDYVPRESFFDVPNETEKKFIDHYSVVRFAMLCFKHGLHNYLKENYHAE